jgi:mRNA interferase MazF
MTDYQWKIFWVSLDPVKGSEQGGKRPVLVISPDEINQSLPLLGILSITTFKETRKIYPTELLLKAEETGLGRDSIVMAHQVRVISKERIGDECGKIESFELKEKIKTIIRKYLDI